MNTKIKRLGANLFGGKTACLLVLVATTGLGLGLVFRPDGARAATGINQQLNFQGRLLDSTGAVVPDGNYNMQFNIYQDGNGVLGGGDETLKWTETRLNNSSQGVVVKNGYFSANLGSITAFGGSVDWNQDTLWLSVHIGGTNGTCTPFSSCAGAETEMSPFKRLTSSPYALNSSALQGLTANNFVQLAQGVQTDSSATNPSIFINKTGGTANILQLQKSSGDVFVIGNSGLSTFYGDLDLTLAGAENLVITNTTASNGVDLASLTLTNSDGAANTQRGLVITNADDAANATTEALISLVNSEASASTVTDGLIISGTAGAGLDTIVDAIDVSDDNITNGINLGTNFLVASSDSINDFTGNAGLIVSANALTIDAATTGTTATTSSNSGLEIGTDGLRLLGGCSSGTTDILKWNGTVWACSADAMGGGSATLQIAYDNGSAGDQIITFDATQDSLILRNPSSSGSDSTYILTLDQLATGARGGLSVQSAGSGNLLLVTDTTATARDVLTIADGGATTFRNQTDSTGAFQIQSAAGGTAVLTVDTTNSQTIARGINSIATLGSELMSSTTCSGTNWSGSGTGPYTHAAGSTANLSCTPPASVTNGATYQVVFTSASVTAGSVTPNVGGAAGITISANSTNETQTISATATTNPTFTPTSDFAGDITIVSVKQVTQTANSVFTLQNSDGTTGLEIRTGGSGLYNTFVGLGSGTFNTTGIQNNAFGDFALYSNTTGQFNNAFGNSTLLENTTGIQNNAFGNVVLKNNTTGSLNNGFGESVLLNNTTGWRNTAMGNWALKSNTTGSENTALGASALNANTTGSYNTAIGRNAGYLDPAVNAFVTLGNLSNSTAIGYGAQVQASNSLILGGQGANAVNVGIGTTKPSNTFSVSPMYYNTGTAWQSGTAISGSGTTWTAAMVGMEFIFSSGESATITAFGSTTSLTASVSQTVSSTPGVAYRIHNPAFYVSSTGSMASRTSTNSATAFQILDNAGTSILTVDTTYTDGAADALTISVTPDDTAGTQRGLVIKQADSANVNGMDSGLVIDNSDTDLAVADGILFTNSGGGFTRGITFAGATTDVTTTGNETLTIAAGGTGDLVLTTTNTGTSALQLNSSGTGGDLDINVNDAITIDSASVTFTLAAGTTDFTITGLDADSTLNLTGLAGNNSILFADTTGIVKTATSSTGSQCLLSGSGAGYTPSWGSCGGGGSTLQGAYDAGSADDQIITLDATQDSIIVRNPSSSGSDSTFTFKIEQLNTGVATNGLYIDSRGTGIALRVDDSSGDTSPFIVDADGRVGIGTASITGSTERLLQVGSLTERGNAAIYGDIISKGISKITGLTNIRDIYTYDTTADSDGGRWIDWATTDQLSWYTETLDDGPSDVCNIVSDDRCYTSNFPRKALLVATLDELYIFDAGTNDMWMKFSQNSAGWALGAATNNDISSVTAVNGVVYVTTNGTSNSGLYVLDFVNDRMWNIDGTDRSGADAGISGRNAAVTYGSDNTTAFDLSVSGTASEWEDLNDVSATYISGSSTAIATGAATNTSPGSGQTFVGLATDSGITVINMTAQKILQYSDATANDYTAVALTKRGRMYGLNTTLDQLEKWHNFDTDKASEINGSPDKAYDETVGPALWNSTPNMIAGAPDALEVIERGSLADDTSDIIYVGHSLGLTEIHDHATATNGWSKFFNTTRQTMLMPNAIDMALMMDDSSGTLANDISFNNTDMTILGSPTLGVQGVRNKAINFDNTDDYLCSDSDQNGTCDTDASHAMTTTGWTWSLWFKHSTTAPASGVDMLLERCVNATPAQAAGCLAAYMTTTGTMVVANDDDATWTQGSSYDLTSTSSLTYNDNQWHQLVIVRTNANDVDTYIDGNPLNLSNATGNTATMDASQIVTIGASCSPTTGANCAAANALNFWDGQIDDVTYGNSTTTIAQLSALQVRRFYNDARPLVAKKVINVTAATTATSTTIGDSGESWIPNEFAGMIVTLTGGTGSGQTRRVTGNTATILTVSPAFQTTPSTDTDFEVDPEALYGASDSVYAVGVTGENPLGQARQTCVGTNNGSDGGGVTCYNHQAGPNLIAELFHGDSEQTDDFGDEWTGTDYDDIRSIDFSNRALVVGSEAHMYLETEDVRLGQALDYIGNQLFNVRAELINDGITLTGSQSLEVGFTGGADLAERYISADTLEPGNVVSLEANNVGAVKKSTTRYQNDLIGIVSTAPGATLGPEGEQTYPVALVGRVPVKVTTENGPIKAGDRVTSSSTPGYGMKAVNAGRVIGAALDDLTEDKYADCPEGTAEGTVCGEVTVFVNLVDYNGEDVEVAVGDAENSGMLWNESFLDPIAGLVDLQADLTAEQAAAQRAQLEKADKILRYLAGRQVGGEAGSEVLADRVSAGEVNGTNIYAGNIFAATLKVDKLQANQIAGLEVFTDKISSLQSLAANSQSPDGNGTSDLQPGSSGQLDLNDLRVQKVTIALDLSVGGGLSVGGPAEFAGNALFRGLVTFIEKTVFKNDVSFEGHILTAGEAPQVTPEIAAGILAAPADNPGAALAEATVDGNDSAGLLEIKIGEGSAAGELVKLTFKKPFAKAPRVMLTAANGSASQAKHYVQSTAEGFVVVIYDPAGVLYIPGTTLKFNYWAAQ